ncbi:MAG: cell division protein FtsL [Deltaproteobacteria bacterium]|nr:cell division protein FtsL [Deltaproteobacteria bacterium]
MGSGSNPGAVLAPRPAHGLGHGLGLGRGSGSKTGTTGLDPLVLCVGIALPVVAAALFHVWANVTSVRLGYALSHASEMHRVLLEENRGLRVELETLRSQKRLEQLARERFHLASPRPEQIVRVRRPETL